MFCAAVETAVRKVDEALQRGEIYHGRIVGIYMFWLVSCVCDVARISINGYRKDGSMITWEHFSLPLDRWVSENKIQYLEALKSTEEPSQVFVSGLRTHLVGKISQPHDAGCMEVYAPRG